MDNDFKEYFKGLTLTPEVEIRFRESLIKQLLRLSSVENVDSWVCWNIAKVLLRTLKPIINARTYNQIIELVFEYVDGCLELTYPKDEDEFEQYKKCSDGVSEFYKKLNLFAMLGDTLQERLSL